MQIGTRPPPRWLRGRDDECASLCDLIRSARSGDSGVLVVRGEAGIGKTALLDYLVDAAPDCRVLRAAGVESEMELAFAGLHQLCKPLLDGLDRLPAPQSQALGVAFGMRSGAPPDRFLIGLGALTLLSEQANERPLVCVIDDAQWLDRASAQSLAFVARRLAAESVVMVIAVRTRADEQIWAGLPAMTLRGLRRSDAVNVLNSAVAIPIDDRVRERILSETRGNPLALLELPRSMTPAELTFGPERTGTRTLTGRMEEGFRRQLDPLGDDTRRLLLIAAAEPIGDANLLWQAAERLGLGTDVAQSAEAAGLIDLGTTVRFRHPLVRSVVYRSAHHRDRQAAHRALADVTDPEKDPDRRAWHRAHAASGPDEAVAAELQRSADRALAHGGLAAGAALLERAARLTPAGSDRVTRELIAAEALVHADAFDRAQHILAALDQRFLTELQRAHTELLRAQIAFASNRGHEALSLLLAAARRLEPLDLESARDTYVRALEATLFAAQRIGEPALIEVAQSARSIPLPAQPRRSDLLLQCMAVLHEDGFVAASPLMRTVVEVFDSDEISVEEGLRFLVLAGAIATDRWDLAAWTSLANRHLAFARKAGALNTLQFALNSVVFPYLFNGDLHSAAAILDEARTLAEIPGIVEHPYGSIGLVAFRGDRDHAGPFLAAAKAAAVARGEDLVVALTSWANAMVCNGNGDYASALRHCRELLAVVDEGRESLLPVGSQPGGWALVELVEAATRCDDRVLATDAAGLLTDIAQAAQTDWALGVSARSNALLHDGPEAEDLYGEAIERLGRTRASVELARTRLLYGEWLRRSGRRTDARDVLRKAHHSLESMGVMAFAERAHRELAATGETARRQSIEEPVNLTAQETHIARLAAEGRTNQEIGTELYLSRHTVEWHLRKVFAKLGLTSRRQLRDVLHSNAVRP